MAHGHANYYVRGIMGEQELKQFRNKEASLWQSAIDKVVGNTPAPSPAAGLGPVAAPAPARAPQDNPIVVAGNEIASLLDQGTVPQIPPPPGAAAGFIETVAFCSKTAFRIAEAKVKSIITGDSTEEKALREEFEAKFGGCDPKWASVIAEYVKTKVGSRQIPYRKYNSLDDFVISGPRFSDNVTIALLADWGTGDDAAKAVLKQIAARNPDVVIHLGDVYYSGTDYEFQNYFYSIWRGQLGLPNVSWGGNLTDVTSRPSTFTLSGNHDMYAGGAPYYAVLDMIGQPSSYFCLRNAAWQFIALDTGLHDSNPTAAGNDVTFLEQKEVDWLKHKIATAGGRKTVLLSHHQLYTAFASEKIGDGFINQRLLNQTSDILPQVTAWFWGHEHNLVIFKRYQKVLGRCIGCGAFPVGRDELGAINPDIPVETTRLDLDKAGGLYQHGYVMIQLAADKAHVTYFQFDPETGTEKMVFEEDL
jgi:hypothetical protein